VLGKSIVQPKYPVCMECKANENTCLFDLGEPCLGPITRGGCDSWCPNKPVRLLGLRGPAVDANVEQMREIMKNTGSPRRPCSTGWSASGDSRARGGNAKDGQSQSVTTDGHG